MNIPAAYVSFNVDSNMFSGSPDYQTSVMFQWPKLAYLANLAARGPEGLNIFKWALAPLKKSRFCCKEGHVVQLPGCV